ncbi:MAG: hypothetical protein Q8N65_00010 [bacterium]|nr:hypothetical protein [bacterium]
MDADRQLRLSHRLNLKRERLSVLFFIEHAASVSAETREAKPLPKLDENIILGFKKVSIFYSSEKEDAMTDQKTVYVFIDCHYNVPGRGRRWVIQRAEGYPDYEPGYLNHQGKMVKFGDSDMIATKKYGIAERICEERGWTIV